MLLKTKSDSLQESRTSPGSAEEQLNKKTTCTILAAHFRRKGHRRTPANGDWIFAGEKMGRPLHLDNLSRRVIRPAVGDRWHGWHAFRRGLATVLFTLGTRRKSPGRFSVKRT